MQLFLTRWRIPFNCYHVLNNFKFGIYTMFKAWWEKMSGSKQTRDRSEACTWCSEVIASCRYGTSRASPPHLSSTCLSNLTKKQKSKIEGTLPALAPGIQKFITTKIYSHHDSYSSKAQFKLYRCFAKQIRCLDLPSPLNSAHQPTLLELMNFLQGLVHAYTTNIYKSINSSFIN